MKLLCGDIGGTNSRLALYVLDRDQSRGKCLHRQDYSSGQWPDMETILSDFLATSGPADAACLAIAGPVLGERGRRQQAKLTNLPWSLDSGQLASTTGISPFLLINDFQAQAEGIAALRDDERAVLQAGEADPEAPQLVIGAGTGLGVALLTPCRGERQAFPSEGGHMHFAPLDEEQDALLKHLRREHGRVSYERLLSGPGIAAIYRFLLQQNGPAGGPSPLLASPDPAAAIANSSDDPLAERTMALFCAIYGACAGDLALAYGAQGGVFVGGGIAPKVLPRLREGGFISAFRAKGRMRPVVERLPVMVVSQPDAGLLGTAIAAKRLLME